MNSDDPLLKILACPLDKGPLHLLTPEDTLYNPRLRRRYPIIDGIPQLLPPPASRCPTTSTRVSSSESRRARPAR